MTITMSSPGDRMRYSRNGFTITELMVVMTITVLLSGAIFSAFGFILRSSHAIANYSDMTSDGRRGLEIFARDVREARDIVDFSSNAITLLIARPGESPYQVVYRYVPNSAVFQREENGDVRILMSGVQDDFQFVRYNILQEVTNSNAETKQIHLNLSMIRRVVALDTTEKVISARYIMRNKHVAT